VYPSGNIIRGGGGAGLVVYRRLTARIAVALELERSFASSLFFFGWMGETGLKNQSVRRDETGSRRGIRGEASQLPRTRGAARQRQPRNWGRRRPSLGQACRTVHGGRARSPVGCEFHRRVVVPFAVGPCTAAKEFPLNKVGGETLFTYKLVEFLTAPPSSRHDHA